MDGTSFIALWRGRISITQYDEEADRFFISYEPGEFEKNLEVALDRERKFEYWMEIDYPEDY